VYCLRLKRFSGIHAFDVAFPSNNALLGNVSAADVASHRKPAHDIKVRSISEDDAIIRSQRCRHGICCSSKYVGIGHRSIMRNCYVSANIIVVMILLHQKQLSCQLKDNLLLRT